MPIVIRMQNADGLLGQCDAKCFDAEGDRCSCVCGGANHGKGVTVALANSAAIAREMTARNPAVTALLDPRTAQTVLRGVLE